MKKEKAVEIYDDVPRVGTWNISKAFGREHFKLLRLIKKHMDLFLAFGALPEKRVQSDSAGRPVDEFRLNNQQILFLMSIVRPGGEMITLKARAIEAGNAIGILQALLDFDFDTSRTRYVYAASDSTGRIKIGISNDPDRRLKELNIGNPDELRLVFTRKATGVRFSDESILHKQCERYKIRSEWFTREAQEILS